MYLNNDKYIKLNGDFNHKEIYKINVIINAFNGAEIFKITFQDIQSFTELIKSVIEYIKENDNEGYSDYTLIYNYQTFINWVK